MRIGGADYAADVDVELFEVGPLRLLLELFEDEIVLLFRRHCRAGVDANALEVEHRLVGFWIVLEERAVDACLLVKGCLFLHSEVRTSASIGCHGTSTRPWSEATPAGASDFFSGLARS